MANVNTTATLNGFYKEVYANDIEKLVPAFAKLAKMIEFRESDMVGNKYHQPVVLSQEAGVTYAAPNSGAFTLNAAIAATVKDAALEGSQIVLRSALDYESAFRASSTKKAFRQATEFVVSNMKDTLFKRLEIELLYGQSPTGIGLVNSLTSQTINIQLGQWSSAIWAGMENCVIDVYQPGGTVPRQTGLVITSIDLTNQNLVVTGTVTGIVSGDIIYFSGANNAGASQEFAGIDKICSNQGVLFGIDASIYSLWRGNQYAVGGVNLSLAKIMDGTTKAVERGLIGNGVMLIPVKQWQSLSTDQTSLRRYESGGDAKHIEVGAESIKYYGQTGWVELVPHLFLKQGDAFFITPEKMRRIGASDITFRRPGNNADIFRELQDQAGFEMRAYTNQALLIEAPARQIKFTGILP